MDQFDIAMKVGSLFCYHGADSQVSEPYLWVIGMKFDGSTLKQTLNRFSWTPDFFFSAGSHGNIGDMQSGITKPISPQVGYWRTSLKEIQLTDANGNSTAVPGAIGFAAVLLEENNVPDGAAEAGHQALNDFVTTKIENFVTGIDLMTINNAVNGRVANGAKREDAMVDEFTSRFGELANIIKAGASDVVAATIRNNMNIAESAWALIDKDEPMGTAFHLVTGRELLKAQNFSVKFTDEIYEEGVTNIEASRYAYNLHSELFAFLRWRPLSSQLPASFDIQVQGIEQAFSRAQQKFYIARVGGVVDGKSWWLKRFDASDMIANGLKRFFVGAPDGSETTIVNVTPPGWHWPYLATPNDGRPDNNLLSLPRLRDVPGFKMAELEPIP